MAGKYKPPLEQNSLNNSFFILTLLHLLKVIKLFPLFLCEIKKIKYNVLSYCTMLGNYSNAVLNVSMATPEINLS